MMVDELGLLPDERKRCSAPWLLLPPLWWRVRCLCRSTWWGWPCPSRRRSPSGLFVSGLALFGPAPPRCWSPSATGSAAASDAAGRRAGGRRLSGGLPAARPDHLTVSPVRDRRGHADRRRADRCADHRRRLAQTTGGHTGAQTTGETGTRRPWAPASGRRARRRSLAPASGRRARRRPAGQASADGSQTGGACTDGDEELLADTILLQGRLFAALMASTVVPRPARKGVLGWTMWQMLSLLAAACDGEEVPRPTQPMTLRRPAVKPGVALQPPGRRLTSRARARCDEPPRACPCPARPPRLMWAS